MVDTDQPREAMARIDAHVHGFPDRLALAVRSHLDRDGLLHGGVLLADVANSVSEQGFDAAWVLPYAHREGVAASVNEWIATESQRYPRLVVGATFHPADERFADLVQRALVELRLRVVKLHCSVGRFSADDPRLQPLWEAAAVLGVPVVVHAGRHSPGETASDDLDTLVPVLREHPGLRLVLAHTGHPSTPRAIELMREFDNLYADVTPVWDRPVDLSTDDLTTFAGRMLFGSDAPNNPIGAGQQAEGFQTLGLDPDVLALLMGGTASRLLRTITPAPQRPAR